MFTTVKLSTSLPIGAVVSFNQQTSTWSAAQDASQLIGIVSTAPFEHDGQWLAGVTFAGTCFALASRAIAPEGGGLAIENGAVYVGALAGAGIVAPVAFDQPAPQAGDLVLVFLR
jgi:hypothetical protein